jgi:hypothetical protein
LGFIVTVYSLELCSLLPVLLRQNVCELLLELLVLFLVHHLLLLSAAHDTLHEGRVLFLVLGVQLGLEVTTFCLRLLP